MAVVCPPFGLTLISFVGSHGMRVKEDYRKKFLSGALVSLVVEFRRLTLLGFHLGYFAVV